MIINNDKILKIFVNPVENTNVARVRYVFDFIENHPLNEGRVSFSLDDLVGADKILHYGKEEGMDLYMPAQALLFAEDPIQNTDLKAVPFYWNELILYNVGRSDVTSGPFFNGQIFAFDLIETIFFHISRYEEYYAAQNSLNEHGMLDGKMLFLPIHSLEKIPVVDHLVFAFLNCLGVKFDPRKTDYILSHDIDKIHKYNSVYEGLKSIAWPLIFKGDLLWSGRNLLAWLRKSFGKAKDPYDSYDFLFRKSTFWIRKEVYFMAGGNTRFDLYDPNYLRKCKGIINRALEKGYLIGLHPSYETAGNLQMMKREKFYLEKISGVSVNYTRQHYLHFLPGKTDRYIDNCGSVTDSSLGYNRFIGFRCGTGFAYKLYDFVLERRLDFLEQPLIVMDSALIHETGDNLKEFKKVLLEFIRDNRNYTQLSFNFHNSTFDPTIFRRRKLKAIYEEMEKSLEEIG